MGRETGDRSAVSPADITAIIPAAGRVPDSVVALSNLTSPAMIPVAGRPVVQWTMSYLISLGITHFRIAVRERGLFVEEFVDCVFGADHDVQFVVPGADRGLGFTIHELASQVDTAAALAVLGDTHFEFADPLVLTGTEPVVLVSEVDESYRWCVAEFGEDRRIKGFRDKVPGLTPPLAALIGVYHFPDVEVLRGAADAVVREVDAAPGGPGGLVDFTRVLERVGESTEIIAADAAVWLDCGNPDTQASSQRVLLEQRAFNQLSVDTTFGTITKRSTRREKFVDEINYLRMLPDHLSVLFPRVIDFSIDWDDPFVTMEFYGYPTLAELFVFENVDAGIWRRVLEHLHHVLQEGFLSHRRPLPPGATHEMLLGKALERLDAIDDRSVLSDLLRRDGSLNVNGRPLRGVNELTPILEDEIVALAASAEGSIIHGDLCFSNILFDLRSGIFKFIDPRGSYGHAGIYGDPRYDIAKLYHSVYGLYDFITADLFRVHVDGTDAQLDIRTRPYHGEIRDEFDHLFFTTFDRREILLATGLIFIGLPALHYDHPNRQLAFYLRGLQILDEALALPRSDQVRGT